MFALISIYIMYNVSIYLLHCLEIHVFAFLVYEKMVLPQQKYSIEDCEKLTNIAQW